MRASQHPEAAFLATMTASATHEVRNVLAIIKESAGLIEDLMDVCAKRGTLDQEKVARAVHRIETHVQRGADLLTNLNRLSHTLDHDQDSVDLDQEVEQLVFLSQRFARKKGHQVEAAHCEKDSTAVVSPLLFHMTLFAAMECCLEELPNGSTLTVRAREEGSASVVEFRGVPPEGEPPPKTTESDDWKYLESMAEAVGAGVERSTAGYGIRLLFSRGTAG